MSETLTLVGSGYTWISLLGTMALELFNLSHIQGQ